MAVIFTTDKIPKILKWAHHVSYNHKLMLLTHSGKSSPHYTQGVESLSHYGQLSSSTVQKSKNCRMYISCCLIMIMLLKHSWKNYTIYTPFIPLNVQVIFTTDSCCDIFTFYRWHFFIFFSWAHILYKKVYQSPGLVTHLIVLRVGNLVTLWNQSKVQK